MKKLFILALSVAAFMTSCGAQPEGQSSAETRTATEMKIEEGTVQVLYFHTKQRCITCRAIEEQTIAALKELNNKSVKLRIVDVSSEEGEPIADKYKVMFSSLFLDNGKSAEDLTKMAFRYARTDADTFKKNLKEEIAKKLQ